MKTRKKLRVGVVMGGPSAEYEISLKTGRNVLKYLNRDKYISKAILISRRGRWSINIRSIKNNFDILFLALHGEYGEDGGVQAFLDRHKICYTGSGVLASKIGMDKVASGKLFRKYGLQTPPFVFLGKTSVSPRAQLIKATIKRLSFPFVAKPTDRGSSVGIRIVENERQVLSAIAHAFQYSSRIMLEKYIKGREFSCGVLERGNDVFPLIPTEIIPSKKHRFFDYNAKYKAGESKDITPPRLVKNLIKKIQQSALVAHKAIKASGYSRSDFILDKANQLYILEINTLPGLTNTSLIPQEAAASGISFGKLLDYVIGAAMS